MSSASMLMSAPVLHDAFLCERAHGEPRGSFPTGAELNDKCQMGIFQDQQNCENNWGPSKRPGTLFHCEAERLDRLSRQDLGLYSLFNEKTVTKWNVVFPPFF
uniref:PPUP9519 n=1 Tax=Poeciliopsis prolifica TaxID=188132 RepID=A0A0S7EIX0_9TELE